MSKLAHSNEETMSQIEAKALFAPCSDFSEDEAFEMLDAAGVQEITWDRGLNDQYMTWIYHNIK